MHRFYDTRQCAAMRKGTRCLLLAGLMALTTQQAAAWSAEGHRIIGRAAFDLLDDKARSAVLDILGQPGEEDLASAFDHACNWPDEKREQAGWRWSAPLHYINLPRHSADYDRERDCPDGRCVTEGILDFSNRLAYPELDSEKRWQALAFVCHLVGDVHQPLHAGFGDDRGGNTVDIRYRGETLNLHEFWDGVLAEERLGDEDGMVRLLAMQGRDLAETRWSPAHVIEWTEESHRLALNFAYPAGTDIEAGFADRTWFITAQRWAFAAARLAQLLNAILGESEVVVE